MQVQFENESKEIIVAFFGSPQNPEAYPNLGEVEPVDPRWHAYYESRPEFARIGLPVPVEA